MKNLLEFVILIRKLTSIYFQLKSQKKFNRQHLLPLIQSVQSTQNTEDSSLSEFDYHKVMFYYGVGTPVMLGNGLALLRGTELSEQEKTAITYMSAITGLYDDFFDKSDYKREDIQMMMFHPEKHLPKNAREKLFTTITIEALKWIPQKKILPEVIRQVFETQWESKSQKNITTTPDELLELTYNKGGIALVFWRLSLSNPMQKGEEKALIQLGKWLQYCNDIFDVYKDLQEGINTHINVINDIKLAEEEFQKMMNITFENFLKLDYPEKNKIKFIQHFKIAAAQTQLCLNQFKKLQEKNNGVFEAKKFSRKQLICDMQKPLNLLKAVQLYLKIQIR